MRHRSFARSAAVMTIAGGCLLAAAVHADPALPTGKTLGYISPAQAQLNLALQLDGIQKLGAPMTFLATISSKTNGAMVDGELMFTSPLAGQHVHLMPPAQTGESHGAPVQVFFKDPRGLGPCGRRDYSVQLQDNPEVASLRVTTSSCTFTTSIEDAWSNESPDRQTGSVYVDNPVVTSAPTCAVGSDFMAVRVGVFNRSKLHASGVSVQLVDATGVTIGTTPAFDLAAGGTATKTVAAGAPASGKVEIRLVDPKHSITGVLGNPGVYAVVKPTCTFKSEVLGAHH